MIEEHNILISSVGGQGGVTLARILSTAALSQGLKVRVGETLGMAQRGGSVESHVRFGESIHSPLIPMGRSDVLLSLEPAEALRAVRHVGARTKVIMNTAPSLPISVILGEATYPKIDEVVGKLRRIAGAVYSFDAVETARKAGAAEGMNIVVLGAYISLIEQVLTLPAVKEAISKTLPARYIQLNMKAFHAGMDKMKELLKYSQT